MTVSIKSFISCAAHRVVVVGFSLLAFYCMLRHHETAIVEGKEGRGSDWKRMTGREQGGVGARVSQALRHKVKAFISPLPIHPFSLPLSYTCHVKLIHLLLHSPKFIYDSLTPQAR